MAETFWVAAAASAQILLIYREGHEILKFGVGGGGGVAYAEHDGVTGVSCVLIFCRKFVYFHTEFNIKFLQKMITLGVSQFYEKPL